MIEQTTTLQDISIKDALAHVRGETINNSNYNSIAQTLHDYECWQPLLDLLKRHENPKNLIDNTLESSKILFFRLDFRQEAVDNFNQLVPKTKMPFEQYYNLLISRLLSPQEYTAQLLFFEKAKDLFSGEDKVKCLQKICFIYEKKTFHDESKVFNYYTELLNLDSKNIKALKFFKTVFIQSSNWSEVEKTSLRLIGASNNPHSRAKEALELSSIYVYQLGKPDIAIKTLDKYWDHSSLDNSTVLLAAYEMLGERKKALKLLENLVTLEKDPQQLAKIHYKIASMHQEKSEWQKTRKHLQLAITCKPDTLQYYESLAIILIKEKKWPEVLRLLEGLKAPLKQDSLIKQVEMTISRIKEVS